MSVFTITFSKVMGSKKNWNIRLSSQFPNSPDINVLDIGVLNALQSAKDDLQYEELPELVHSVQQTTQSLSLKTKNSTFIPPQKVLESSMDVVGGNPYKMAHVEKSKMKSVDQRNHNVICDSGIFSKRTQCLQVHLEAKFHCNLNIQFYMYIFPHFNTDR